MATLSTASGFPYPATSEIPDVQRDLKALADYLEAKTAAWSTWTPTLTGFTPGNGVATGYYMQLGKLLVWRAKFTLGSTSVAAAATPKLSMPATLNGSMVYIGMASGFFQKNGGSIYQAVCEYNSATTVELYIPGTNGIWTTPSTTTPFTWAANDVIVARGIAQVA